MRTAPLTLAALALMATPALANTTCPKGSVANATGQCVSFELPPQVDQASLELLLPGLGAAGTQAAIAIVLGTTFVTIISQAGSGTGT